MPGLSQNKARAKSGQSQGKPRQIQGKGKSFSKRYFNSKKISQSSPLNLSPPVAFPGHKFIITSQVPAEREPESKSWYRLSHMAGWLAGRLTPALETRQRRQTPSRWMEVTTTVPPFPRPGGLDMCNCASSLGELHQAKVIYLAMAVGCSVACSCCLSGALCFAPHPEELLGKYHYLGPR